MTKELVEKWVEYNKYIEDKNNNFGEEVKIGSTINVPLNYPLPTLKKPTFEGFMEYLIKQNTHIK